MPNGADRIPVIVLSGFLGSGKTTLLNALLRDEAFSNTAVIVNELGEIGIDDLLVTSIEDGVVLLNAGCLCCGLLGSLRETLLDLHARRLQGRTPPFRRIVVETTGLADPAPILQSLLRDASLTPLFELDQLTVVVDALMGEAELDSRDEARRQVALADRLVLSKTDIASSQAVQTLRSRLAALNPAAPVSVGRGTASTAAEIFAAPAGRHPRPIAVAMANHAHHDPTVRADSFYVPGPIHWSGVAAWTDVVREFFGARMLRAKGLIAVEGVPGPVLIQGVQTVFAAPERLGAWPDEDRRSRLVCISEGIDGAVVEASLAALHTAPGEHRPATLDALMALARGRQFEPGHL